MQQELLIAVLAGLGGMLGWGLADFFAKKTINEIGDIASLAWGHIFGTLILILFVVLQFKRGYSIQLPDDSKTWLILIIFGTAQAAVYLFVYNGFGKGQISILNPIFASFSGITAILSIVLFKEQTSILILFGLAILFLGILLISTDFTALRDRKISFAHIPGFKEIAIATLMAAFWTLYWDKFIGGNDWLMYTLFMYGFMTVTILLVAWIRRISLSINSRSLWKLLFFIGFFETFAYLAISIGYSSTSFTSVVALLSGAFSLPTIILAKMYLNEQITKTQTIGSLVIIAGIMVISLS